MVSTPRTQALNIVQLRVDQPLAGADSSGLPLALPPVPQLRVPVVRTRKLTLEEGMDPVVPGRLLMLLNGLLFDANRYLTS